MNPNNVYVNFRYENTSGAPEDIIFDDITKRVPILHDPSQYEVGVTNVYMKVSPATPISGDFTRVVVMSNSIGVSEEFSNNVQNDLQPIISDFQYNPSGSTFPSYTAGYIQFPGVANSEVHYRDLNNSEPLYRLNLSVKASMKDGTYEYFRSITGGSASVTLHFRKKSIHRQ